MPAVPVWFLHLFNCTLALPSIRFGFVCSFEFIRVIDCASHLLHQLHWGSQVLDRGERIELLVHKTDSLQAQAFTFRRQSRCLHHHMW